MKATPATSLPSWLFFPLTFAISWALWIPAALLDGSHMELPVAPLYLLGGFGPSLAAVLLVSLRHAPAYRRDFWQRATDFRRIRPIWYLLVLLAVPLITAAAYGLDALLGGGPYALPTLQAALAQPVMIIPTLIITLIAGPLSEELGWRGYILDRMQARWSALPAALLLGLIWWSWHLPLFFIQGTSHSSWGLWSPQSALFLLQVLPLSVFISLAYNRNRRSTLAAILIHFAFNLVFGMVFPVPLRVEVLRLVLLTLFAAGLAWVPGEEKKFAVDAKG